MIKDRPEYPGLDTLRALAAISVLATHTSFWTGQYTKGLWGAASSRLDIGVAFFFVLSGFLLGRPFLAAIADRRPAPGTVSYFWKRALRIVPLYVIAVVIALTVLHDNRGASLGTWLSNLTLTRLYFSGQLPAGLTQMWSLTTEVAFYLLLPALMALLGRVACRRRWNPYGLLAGLGLLVAVNVAWIIQFTGLSSGSSQWLPAFLSWFSVGLALAVVSVDLAEGSARWSFLTALSRQPGTCWAFAVALFVIAATPIAGPILAAPTTGAALSKNLLYAAIAGIVVLPSVLGPVRGTRYADALAWAPLRHLGHISYGIFCLHLLVIHLFADQLNLPLFQGHGWQLFALTLVITIVLAEVAYRVVERPIMRLKDRRIGSSKASTATPATDASASH